MMLWCSHILWSDTIAADFRRNEVRAVYLQLQDKVEASWKAISNAKQKKSCYKLSLCRDTVRILYILSVLCGAHKIREAITINHNIYISINS